MSSVFLGIHIAVGVVGLVLGPIVFISESRRIAGAQRPNDGWGAAYHAAVLTICVSAVLLVIVDRPDLWLLVIVATLSYGLVLMGRMAGARALKEGGWSHAYVHGIAGSYIALVTALLVVALTVDGPIRGPAELIPWILPAAVGTPLIELWRRRLLSSVARSG